ncbi:hypothetical protein GCM10010462_16810 [Microbacterium dextranolyticum]|uniref:Uncharacterized protein n=1 Tax=Microbacterium dextranolyticum TaxID=36806 RepID=A0A9W6HLS3_9MICO|nr:hypothetical protein GCM10017591_09350 [Microbacterium dextranolyticum]
MVAAIAGILVWSQVGVMTAEPEPLAAVRADAAIAITDDAAVIVLAPSAGGGDAGLVFIPGAKVDPWAYASMLAGLVADDGMTVVITKPWLNLAFFDLRPLSSFTDLAPGPTGGSWAGIRSGVCAPASSLPTRTVSCCSPRTARATSRDRAFRC